MATLSPSRVTLKEGENVDLSCTTSGEPAPDLIWSTALVSNYEVCAHAHACTRTQTHKLIILSVQLVKFQHLLCVPAFADQNVGADFSAATIQPFITGPQQQDQLHSREHCWREGVLPVAGYTLYVPHLPLNQT